ncbi:MAG: hypothetical protein ACERKD_01765 [Prolixibacteraceae bacterium]
MKTTSTAIIDKSAQIIMNSGLEALTIPNLLLKMGIAKNELHNQITKDDDLILMLLLAFENELNTLVQEIANTGIEPETKIKLLFKNLYSLFLQKPYYLALIFDKSLMNREHSIKAIMLRIKNTAETYLSTLINTGKMDNTFKTKMSTKLLVGKILSSFRLLMKNEQRVNEMILELKDIRTTKKQN